MSTHSKKMMTHVLSKFYEKAHAHCMSKVDAAIARKDRPSAVRALLTGQRIIDRIIRDYEGLEDL